MYKNQAKKLLKIAVLIYAASFLILNWNDVSWIFNYRTVYGLVDDFFNPYPTIDASSMSVYFYPNRGENKTAETLTGFKTKYTEKQNTLEVPKLSLEVPIIFSSSVDKNVIKKDLDSGVVYYPGSVYPGQQGQAVILGHSAPPNWPKIKYDWVFNDLDKLGPGDVVMINLNNKQYTYKVKEKIIIKKGQEIPPESLISSSNTLILISCYPPGKDYQRIAIFAELGDSL